MIPVVVPWSGGVDSTYLVCQLLIHGYWVYPYHVSYGDTRYYAEETAIDQVTQWVLNQEYIGRLEPLMHLSYSSPPVRTSYIQHLSPDDRLPYDIPFRNGVVFSLGVAYAEASGIRDMMVSIEAGPAEYRDHSLAFLTAFSSLLATSSFVQITAPVRDKDVAERYRFCYECGIHPYVTLGANEPSGHL